jgi:putative ABC transport system permease protein
MSLMEDVRFGFRTLSKNPGFTAVAITALALGIGVNATVFSLSNAILFKNLPFANSDHVLYIISTNSTKPRWYNGISYPDYLELRARLKSFDAVGASTQVSADISDHTASPEGYHGARVTVNTFSLLGQKPIAGRDFLPADGEPGAAPVAILSYKVWENRYGKDLSVVGRTVRIDEEPTTIIGVMPQRLDFPRETEVWKPLVLKEEYMKRENRRFQLYGHVAKPSILKSASVEVNTVMQNLAAAYPITNKNIGGRVIDYNEYFAGNESEIRIACANVANLQLGRAVSRMREISIRVALGAGRWRIIRQLLVESLILSIAGGVIGWMIAIWGTRTFDNAVIAAGKPPAIDFSMDLRALIYLAVITIGTGLLFGLAPALRLSRLDVNTSLKDGGRGSSGGRGKYLSGLLVVVEMALAVVLLAGAGLMIRSFLNAYRGDIGIRIDNILTMEIQLPNKNYLKPEQQLAFFDRLKPRIGALPGVESATVTSNIPLSGSWGFPYEVEGEPQPDARLRPNIDTVITTLDYFRVMGDQILAGRDFTAADGLPSSMTVLVNRQFAQGILKDENPLGRRIRLYKKDVAQPWLTVVGVVPNLPYNNQTRAKRDPTIYIPYRLETTSSMFVAARTSVPPSTLKQAFRHEVQAIDDGLPVLNLRTMDEQMEQRNWPYRVFGSLFAIFAAIALVLASVGLYAVIAHSVSQRTQEIGVRMALGATGSNVMRLVFSQGMTQLAIGLVIGLGAALGVTKVLKALLVDVSPSDPLTFIITALVLTMAAAGGCLIPARRAMRVDPIEALRHE